MTSGDRRIRQSSQPPSDRRQQETYENTESGKKHSRPSSKNDLWQKAAREREQSREQEPQKQTPGGEASSTQHRKKRRKEEEKSEAITNPNTQKILSYLGGEDLDYSGGEDSDYSREMPSDQIEGKKYGILDSQKRKWENKELKYLIDTLQDLAKKDSKLQLPKDLQDVLRDHRLKQEWKDLKGIMSDRGIKGRSRIYQRLNEYKSTLSSSERHQTSASKRNTTVANLTRDYARRYAKQRRWEEAAEKDDEKATNLLKELNALEDENEKNQFLDNSSRSTRSTKKSDHERDYARRYAKQRRWEEAAEKDDEKATNLLKELNALEDENEKNKFIDENRL